MAKSKRRKKKRLKYNPDLSKYRISKIVPPEGFQLVEPSPDDVSQAKSKISKLLNHICETIPISCWVKVKDYPKASEVDGWLVVSGVKGADTHSIISMIQEAFLPDVSPDTPEFSRSILGKGYWISVGLRWQGSGNEEEIDQYKKWHGMTEVSSYYRSMSDEDTKFKARSKILSAFNATQLPSSKTPTTMISNIEKKFNKTIAEVFVKVVWNARNAQPLRSGPEEKPNGD
jgi:hypothetical protein